MSSKDQKTLDGQATEEIEQQQPAELEEESMELESSSNNIDLEEIMAQLAEVQKREQDIVIRSRAEVENIRRRAQQDVEKAHKFALEKFSSDLLPVIDNLERALEAMQKDEQTPAALVEGVELTLKSLLDVVRKYGIDVVDDIHVPFNPEVHQAMTLLESEECAPGHVLMVMQKGYLLNGRLLRPAMVAVSQANAAQE